MWTSEMWEKIVDQVSEACNLNKQYKKKLLNNNVCKLIAATPFLVGSPDPERQAFAGALLFVGATRTKAFWSKPTDLDDKFWSRLSYLWPYRYNDNHRMTCIMYRLMLCQIADHRKDQEIDLEEGKYNPFNACQIEAEGLHSMYLKNQIIDEEVDAILPIEEARSGFWWE